MQPLPTYFGFYRNSGDVVSYDVMQSDTESVDFDSETAPQVDYDVKNDTVLFYFILFYFIMKSYTNYNTENIKTELNTQITMALQISTCS